VSFCLSLRGEKKRKSTLKNSQKTNGTKGKEKEQGGGAERELKRY